jgi:hypothetical protein
MIDLNDGQQLALSDRSKRQVRATDPASQWQAGIAAGQQDGSTLPSAAGIDLLWLALPPSLCGLGMTTATIFAKEMPKFHLWDPNLATLNRRALVIDPYRTLSPVDVGNLPLISPSAAPPEDAHPVAVWGYLMALYYTFTGHPDEIEQLSTVAGAHTDDCVPSVSVTDNRAKQLTHRLYDRIPIFWGEGAHAGVALDWRHRYVRYTEARAEWTQLDVIRHVDVMARFPRYWPQAGIYVQLTHPAPVSESIVLLRQLWQARRIQQETFTSTSSLLLPSIYELLCMGEWVALYAAAMLGVDPMDRVALDFLGVR